VLEADLDLIGDSLVLLSDFGLLLVVVLDQTVQVLGVSNFLFLLGNLKGADVLLKFTLGDTVLILDVLKGYLAVLLKLGQLILVLEHQML